MCNQTSELHNQVEATMARSDLLLNQTNQLQMESMDFQTEAKELLDKVRKLQNRSFRHWAFGHKTIKCNVFNSGGYYATYRKSYDVLSSLKQTNKTNDVASLSIL